MEILGSRMDTFWTPEEYTEAAENGQFENDIGKIRVFKKRRGTQVAEGAGLLNRESNSHIPRLKTKPIDDKKDKKGI